ncbi:MAG: hypothetical protein R3C32_10375 [Chloroflexota bacterium]
MRLTKTASPTTLPEPGGAVTFTVLIENCSTLDAITIDSLVDDPLGDLDGRGTCSVPQDIDPGDSYGCSVHDRRDRQRRRDRDRHGHGFGHRR